MDAFGLASQLLQLQHHVNLSKEDLENLESWIHSPLLILPAASRGHAMCFVRYHNWWAKIDRGENSLKEGSVNIYEITRPEAFTVSFLRDFLYKKQSRNYFHAQINQKLGLNPIAQIPISSQITGNCSWANIQAAVPTAFALQGLYQTGQLDSPHALEVYDNWVEWDKDRALDECVHRFYLANPLRKASLASMLGAVLFQACDYGKVHHVKRAEKIMTILALPEYYYILKSYLDIYCLPKLTRKGNNLLKLLDDCGFNPNIGVTPIATGL
jgi:hypothetical protein